MPVVAKLDDLGKPAWIVLMLLGFIYWWPVGLATLAFLIGSGRMGSWKSVGMSRWHGGDGPNAQCWNLVAAFAIRQPGLRRIPDRNPAAP
jgi:Protein of unknown function (DUF2852)